jgi:hypothetical protein
MLGTATMSSCTPGDELLALRRELAWLGAKDVLHEFHAAL